MQHFFLLFLGSWLLGIISGANGSLVWGVSIAVVAATVCWQYRYPLPFIIATLALASLGWVHGLTAQQPVGKACDNAAPAVITISQRAQHKSQSSRYVVMTPAHCQLVVTLARFPEFHVGDRLAVAGGTFERTDVLMRRIGPTLNISSAKGSMRPYAFQK